MNKDVEDYYWYDGFWKGYFLGSLVTAFALFLGLLIGGVIK